MDRLKIQVETRDLYGKGAASRLRADGFTPAVIYGVGGESVSVKLNSHDFEYAIHHLSGEHALVDIQVGVDGDAHPALIQDIQYDPLRDNPIHVDFLRVRMDEKLNTTVPLILTGTSVGVKQEGGVLDQVLRDIEIECLPANLPEELEIDVTEMAIGDSMHVSDLTAPEGVTILTSEERVLANVMAPRILEEVLPEGEEMEEEGAVEPERIGEEAEEGEEAGDGGEENG